MKKLFLYFCTFGLCLGAYEISPEIMARQKAELWSLQPLRVGALELKDSWCETDIDHFIINAMRTRGLTPSAKADKRTLIRRAYYNLTGLPPTAEELNDFLSDTSGNAYENLIDHLLAQPEYGEKWARHWMDVARYADTTGFFPAGRDQNYPFSYTYRDYLIRAFNEDKPYTDFILEQLAADKISLKDKRDLAALGFQTAADRFLNRQQEIINDRIDVTTQGFLGLTVACARCHDHKFDPIPTADYYSLYGVFASTFEPQIEELPVIEYPADKELFAKYKSKDKKLKSERQQIYQEYRDGFFTEWQELAHEYIDYIGRTLAGEKGLKLIDSRGRQMRRQLVMDVKFFLLRERRQDSLFGFWNSVVKAEEGKLSELINSALKNKRTASVLKEALKEADIQSKNDLFILYKNLIKKIIDEKDNYQEIYHAFAGDSFRSLLEKNDVKRYASNAEDDKITEIDNKLKVHFASHGSPARAMVVRDKAKLYDPHIFIRGNNSSRGEAVKRRFLQALSYDKSHEEFKQGSGRLELAKSIADPKNPLTARVLVNRVWHWHFGRGLVDTPSNFGVLGSKPSHPELLDYLASWFMSNGWSIKKLNKLIMTSAVYQQKSENRPKMSEKDGANIYLWKMNSRRLGWEELRDSVVKATGKMKPFAGGPSVKLLLGEYQPHRTIYGFIKRDGISGAAKAFDFPSAEITCETRSNTIVPQQGLFLMNSPFIMRSSRMIMAKIRGNRRQKIESVFKQVYGRDPLPQEIEFCQQYLNKAESLFKERVLPEWLFGYAKLNDDDQLQTFTEFTFFNKSRWQISKSFPNKDAGHAMLTENGGHPGKENIAVVRRCKMHKTGKLSISGLLKHKSVKGDGVRVLIMHNGEKIAEWDCQAASVSTELDNIEVVAGDFIDLIVDAKKSTHSDAYLWPVEMAMTMPTSNEKIPINQDFKKQQARPAFSAFHGLAQVLIMSNEFLYVD